MFRIKMRRVLALWLLAVSLATGAEARGQQPGTDLYGDPLPPGALMRLGSVRLRHLGSEIAYSSDGKTLISFSRRDNTLRHWDPATGRELRRTALQGAERIKRNANSAWNENIVVMEDGVQLVLWDTATGKERRRLAMFQANVHSLTVSPTGDTVAGAMAEALLTGQAETVRLWDVASGGERPRLDYSALVVQLAFSPDGKLLGTVGLDRDVRLWNVWTGKLIRTIRGAGSQLVFSPDGSQVATVGSANRELIVKVWGLADEQEAAIMPKVEGTSFISVRFSPDGKILATAGVREIILFDIAGRKLLHRIPTTGWIAFAPDGKTLASGLNAIHLWDPATGREVNPRPGHDGPINCLVATADGTRVVSLSPYDGLINLWDVACGKAVVALRAGHFRELNNGALSSDGKRFAAGGNDGKVRLWDLLEGREVQQWSVDLRNAQGQSNAEIIALSFSSQDRQLAAVSMAWHTRSGFRPKYQLDLWDLDTGKSVARRALPMESWLVRFDAPGRTMVFRTRDGLVIQDVATGKEWMNLAGELRAPFVLSPDGQVLAATVYQSKATPPVMPPDAEPESKDARAVVLMELVTGKQLRRIETGTKGFSRLAFAPDGRTLATADGEGFRLWDAATGKEVFRRAFPETTGVPGYSFATALAFLPRGDRLATGMTDGTILIWDLEPKRWHTGGAATTLDGRDLERLWNDLAGEDAAQAHQAVWTLAAAPAKAVPFLKDHLRPASAIDGKQVQRWIADLDSKMFAVREDAGKKLAAVDERAEPILRQALAGQPSLEVRKRLEALLADAELESHGIVRSAETLRTLRAIRALEHFGTREARQVLEALASGDPAARTTRHAKEALQRCAAKR